MSWQSTENPTDPGAKISSGHPFYDLIKEAYLAFDGYKPNEVDVCTDCCMPKDIEADFFRPNIKELPFRYLQEWFDAACPTDGVRKDIWSYLLPRTLEVLAAGEDPKNVGIEVSLSRFDTGNPSHWSDKQWSVLDRFQRRFLQSSSPSTGAWCWNSLDEIICMFTLGGWQLDDLWSQVMSMADEQLVERLYQDWCGTFGDYGNIDVTEFWKEPDKARVRAFYTSEQLRQRLETFALSDNVDAEIAAKASAIVSVIDNGI
jgi:hypothetical protein